MVATRSGKQRPTAHLRAARKRLLYTGGGLPVQVRWNYLAHAEEQPALLTTAKSLLTDLCLPARNPYSSVDPHGEDVVPHGKHSLMALPASQACFSYSLIPCNTPLCTGAMVITGLTGTFAHVKEPDSRKTFTVLSIKELDIRSMNV